MAVAVQVPVSPWPSWPPMVTSTSVTLRPSEAKGIGHKTVKNGKILENIKELTKTYGGFHKWGTPKKFGLYKFIMENPIKVDDLGVLLFQETTISRLLLVQCLLLGQSPSCPSKHDGRTQAQLGPCRSVLCCCPPAVKPWVNRDLPWRYDGLTSWKTHLSMDDFRIF